MRYFISYYNLKNNCKLDKKVDINSDDLKLLYDKGEEEFIIKPLYLFAENVNDLDEFIKKTEEARDNLHFMVELTEEEAGKVHPIFLKRFKDNKLTNRDKTIKLLQIDNDIYNRMTYEEEEKVKSIYLKCNEDKSLSISLETIRKDKKSRGIGEGEYYYTESNRILDKYNDNIIEIEETNRRKYKLKKYKVIGIDSVGRDRLIGLSREVCAFYYSICHNSKILYVDEEDNNCLISSKKDDSSKKIFVLDNNIMPLLITSNDLDILNKYINIYELNGSCYKRIPFNEYKKELKYIKKPSNN